MLLLSIFNEKQWNNEIWKGLIIVTSSDYAVAISATVHFSFLAHFFDFTALNFYCFGSLSTLTIYTDRLRMIVTIPVKWLISLLEFDPFDLVVCQPIGT